MNRLNRYVIAALFGVASLSAGCAARDVDVSQRGPIRGEATVEGDRNTSTSSSSSTQRQSSDSSSGSESGSRSGSASGSVSGSGSGSVSGSGSRSGY